jgi:hypothetical protein
MDEKKHTMLGENWQLQDAKFSLKNGSPAADRVRRVSEWPEYPVEHSVSKERSVFVPDLLCLLRLGRGVAAELTLFNRSIGGSTRPLMLVSSSTAGKNSSLRTGISSCRTRSNGVWRVAKSLLAGYSAVEPPAYFAPLQNF